MTKNKEVKELDWSFGVDEFQDLTSGKEVIGTTLINGEEFVMKISLRDIGWDMMRTVINLSESQVHHNET